jgi:hydrogenase nickel incorporation protein HypB
MARLDDALARVMPSPKVIKVSAKSGQGLDQWVAWLEQQRLKHGLVGKVAGLAPAHTHAPKS